MKKKILMFLSILILSSTVNAAYSKMNMTTDLSDAIKLYKAGNYTACYDKLNVTIKKDPSNALAYYYMAMTSAQIGKKQEAISNYEKAISLTPTNNNLRRFAQKGKLCLESPDKCSDAFDKSDLDSFIYNRALKESDAVRGEYEKLKIENLMREINRSEEIDPARFKEYRDFSTSSAPTNDEIVAAIRTLQNAGLGNLFSANNYSDLSLLTGGNQMNSSLYNMMGTSMSPQLIQQLLTNSIQGF